MSTSTSTTHHNSRNTAAGVAGVREFTPAQLLRMARLFAGEAGCPSGAVESLGDLTAYTERQRIELTTTPHLQVWLMVWPAGSQTGWHDHGEAAGAYVVVQGSLHEHVHTVNRTSVRELVDGDEASFGVGHVHEMSNPGDEPALTVHAYSPGLTEMTPYEFVNGSLVSITP